MELGIIYRVEVKKNGKDTLGTNGAKNLGKEESKTHITCMLLVIKSILIHSRTEVE